MVRNADFTHKHYGFVRGTEGIHRNALIKMLSGNVCRVVSVHGSEIKAKRCTLPKTDPGIQKPVSYHDQIAVWDVDAENWTTIDIHKVKSVEIEPE